MDVGAFLTVAGLRIDEFLYAFIENCWNALTEQQIANKFQKIFLNPATNQRSVTLP